MAQEDETKIKRYRRWFNQIENKYGGKIKEALVWVVIAEADNLSGIAEAFRNLAEIGRGIAAKELEYRDIGADEYRFKTLRENVITIYLRLAFDMLRRGSSYEFAKDPVRLKACEAFWLINQFYVVGDTIDPVAAGIMLDDYYSVLVKADRAIRIAGGRDI